MLDFATRYEAKYDEVVTLFAGAAYDSFHILLEGLKAGGDDKAQGTRRDRGSPRTSRSRREWSTTAPTTTSCTAAITSGRSSPACSRSCGPSTRRPPAVRAGPGLWHQVPARTDA